jgi:hypothetical protein
MLINYFAILVVLLLVSGLAVDAGMLEWRQIHLQNAADAAAQQGMYQLGRNDSAYATEALTQASANGFTNGVNGTTVTIAHPPTSTAWIGDPWSVQATVAQGVPNLLMGLVGAGKSTVASTAVARVLPTCLWIMNPTQSSGSAFQLASAGLSGPCGLYVNTSSGTSMTVDGFSTLANLRTRVVGPASSNGSSGNVTPQPRFGSAKKNDPLAYVTSPVFSSCTPGYTSVSVTGGSYTASPGTYCGGITVTSATVTLNPGLYIITGGITLKNSTLNGTSGVTLFFTQGGGYGYGTVSISGTNGSSTSFLYLKAPTTTANGGVPGISIFGDRNWVTHGSQGFSITYTNIYDDGIWYFPNTGLYLWESPMTFYSYNGLVVDNFYSFGSTSTFHTDYSPLGGSLSGSPYHYEDGALVE